MFGTVPYTFDVDVLGEIPDLLWGIDSVIILLMHDAGVVEHDVYAAILVLGLDCLLHGGFVRDVTDDGGYTRVSLGHGLGDFGNSFVEGGLRDVGHEDGAAFTEEEDCGFKTNATGSTSDAGYFALKPAGPSHGGSGGAVGDMAVGGMTVGGIAVSCAVCLHVECRQVLSQLTVRMISRHELFAVW